MVNVSRLKVIKLKSLIAWYFNIFIFYIALVPEHQKAEAKDLIENFNNHTRMIRKGCAFSPSAECNQDFYESLIIKKHFSCDMCDKDGCNSVSLNYSNFLLPYPAYEEYNSVSSLQNSLMLTIIITLMTIFGV